MSNKTEWNWKYVARDDKSNSFIFYPQLAYGMVRNVRVFFLSNINSKSIKKTFSVTISQAVRIRLFWAAGHRRLHSSFPENLPRQWQPLYLLLLPPLHSLPHQDPRPGLFWTRGMRKNPPLDLWSRNPQWWRAWTVCILGSHHCSCNRSGIGFPPCLFAMSELICQIWLLCCCKPDPPWSTCFERLAHGQVLRACTGDGRTQDWFQRGPSVTFQLMLVL